jgi:hypothetical protein
MPTEDLSSRRWLLRYTVETAFLVLLAAAAIGGAFYVRHAEYVGGTKNSSGDGFLPAMPTPQEGAVDLSGSEVEFRRPIKPGVYVFDRG